MNTFPPVDEENSQKRNFWVDLALIGLGVSFFAAACFLLFTMLLKQGVDSSALAENKTNVTVPGGATEISLLDRSYETPVIVMFDATWCTYCRQLKPILEEAVAGTNGDVILVRVDVDDNPKLVRRYAVRSVPTVKAFVNAQEVDGFIGLRSESFVVQFVKKLSV
jgi:thioredoxin-like negative regulator of GroEL